MPIIANHFALVADSLFELCIFHFALELHWEGKGTEDPEHKIQKNTLASALRSHRNQKNFPFGDPGGLIPPTSDNKSSHGLGFAGSSDVACANLRVSWTQSLAGGAWQRDCMRGLVKTHLSLFTGLAAPTLVCSRVAECV